MKEVISKWTNYQIKKQFHGNEGIKKEIVLRMHGSWKHEVNSHDTVQLICSTSPATDNVDVRTLLLRFLGI
jgi:hypothetical protein